MNREEFRQDENWSAMMKRLTPAYNRLIRAKVSGMGEAQLAAHPLTTVPMPLSKELFYSVEGRRVAYWSLRLQNGWTN